MATGLDLKVERIRSRITATALAGRMGVSRQRVSQVETFPTVTPEMAERYRAAILQLTEQTQTASEAA